MTYVDPSIWLFRGMKMCHLLADTPEELHEMAGKIGLKKEWVQSKPVLHYDLCLSKRELAIKNGAKEVSIRELANVIKRIRGK